MRFMSDRNDWFAGAEERNNCSDKGSKDSNLQYNKSYGEKVYKVSDEKEVLFCICVITFTICTGIYKGV